VEFEMGTHNRLMAVLFVSLFAIAAAPQSLQTRRDRLIAVTRMLAVIWLWWPAPVVTSSPLINRLHLS
jgi:hypothetical protein